MLQKQNVRDKITSRNHKYIDLQKFFDIIFYGQENYKLGRQAELNTLQEAKVWTDVRST